MVRRGEEETLDAGKRLLARFRSSGNISAEKAIFNGLPGAVRKYRFIGSLNESLTRHSITCT